jgi:hypothetical protein
MADAAVEFQALARALTDAGETGLKRELYKAISDTARPLAREIGDVEHLKPYMPDPYAAVLASDLAVRISKRTGTNPGVFIRALGRTRNRHVERIEQGILRHPVFGTEAQLARFLAIPRSQRARAGHGRGWTWRDQDVRPGFFADPVDRAGPEMRRQIQAAVRRIIRKIYAAH